MLCKLSGCIFHAKMTNSSQAKCIINSVNDNLIYSFVSPCVHLIISPAAIFRKPCVCRVWSIVWGWCLLTLQSSFRPVYKWGKGIKSYLGAHIFYASVPSCDKTYSPIWQFWKLDHNTFFILQVSAESRDPVLELKLTDMLAERQSISASSEEKMGCTMHTQTP